MKSEIKYLPYLNLVNGQYIFVGGYKDPVRKGFLNEKELDEKIYPQLILPISAILDDNYIVNSQGIIEERNPYCKHCGSKKFSVRNSLKNGGDVYRFNDELELSRYYGYDEQWIKIEGKWQYRLELFDIINNMINIQKITPKIVEDFIDISIHPKHRKAIITDLKEEYDQIMRKLGFAH